MTEYRYRVGYWLNIGKYSLPGSLHCDANRTCEVRFCATTDFSSFDSFSLDFQNIFYHILIQRWYFYMQIVIVFQGNEKKFFFAILNDFVYNFQHISCNMLPFWEVFINLSLYSINDFFNIPFKYIFMPPQSKYWAYICFFSKNYNIICCAIIDRSFTFSGYNPSFIDTVDGPVWF